jgi:hypothetical protein
MTLTMQPIVRIQLRHNNLSGQSTVSELQKIDTDRVIKPLAAL